MNKQIINGTTVYTLGVSVTATYDPAKNAIVGNVSIPDLLKVPLEDRTRIEFKPKTYRLMASTEILEEDGWLVQLVPVSPGSSTVMLSVGGEYLADVNISEVPELLKKVIYI